MASVRNDKPPFQIWDFSGYNDYTTEPLPNKRNEKMHYYYDGSHFLPIVGDKMLEQMMSKNNPEAPSGFGRLLTSRTLDNALAEERKERGLFLSSAHVAQELGDFDLAVNKIKKTRAANCRQIGNAL
jgi:hypothetical protein